MDPSTHNAPTDSEAIVINHNLSIEISLDEILDDLLYPASRAAAAK